MSDLQTSVANAAGAGKLLESTAKNIGQMLAGSTSPVYEAAVRELVTLEAWQELNDRFFRTLAFGTGGLRGRTIGKIVTAAERGTPAALDRPQYPCVGTHAMNFFNISRATQGLVAYLKDWFAKEKRPGRPKIAIAHDTRHFSRDFAEYSAKVAVELGCDVALVESARSTPELSFAVRHYNATAGIVITASHNPSHDNGFKCYFEDGAQVVEPHASAIIAKVNAVASDAYTAVSAGERGRLEIVGKDLDDPYMARLQTLVLDPKMVAAQKDLKVVYTNLHGTGGVIVKPMLERLGFGAMTVPEQDVADGRFPTVKSPNPENAEALTMAVALANKTGADVVIATDPDCDRMGAAVRSASGDMKLLTGNQAGSLMAFYRAEMLVRQGVLTPDNVKNAVIIKTLVTTDLQKAIAAKHGIRCVETLTGFKYIGAKLLKYEMALPEDARANYKDLTEEETRALRLAKSTYYVFGGEESYGYSGADFIRDKDGNGAAVMFAEVAAYAKSRGLTVDALLDEVFAEFGFYMERGTSMTFEGAEGAAKIQKLIATYSANPPAEIDGVKLTAIKDFAKETFKDVEGDALPAEKMMMFELADGTRVAVRPSGTEPKIKYYMFAHRKPKAGARFSAEELSAAKQEVERWIDRLWAWIEKDASVRLG